MGYDKGHQEFHGVDMKGGFHTVPGYPWGFSEKILAGSLDEKNKVGNRTRILKIEAGAFSTVPCVHEYWEEVFLVSGDLVCGSDDKGKGGESFTGPTYCVRPPGVHHGPFTSKNGCLLLETHHYVTKSPAVCSVRARSICNRCATAVSSMSAVSASTTSPRIRPSPARRRPSPASTT